jgi:hypothetical protein
MKTNELTGAALDWAVATALGRGPKYNMESHGRTWRGWWLAGPGYDYEPMPSYSTNWAQGGSIIEREGIELQCNTSALQAAAYKNANPDWFACLKFKRADHWHGTTPLIAAMRCYVASKLGDDINIPEELL